MKRLYPFEFTAKKKQTPNSINEEYSITDKQFIYSPFSCFNYSFNPTHSSSLSNNLVKKDNEVYKCERVSSEQYYNRFIEIQSKNEPESSATSAFHDYVELKSMKNSGYDFLDSMQSFGMLSQNLYLLEKIIVLLHFKDILRLEKTCKSLYNFINSNLIWIYKLKGEFRLIYNERTITARKLYEYYYMSRSLQINQLPYQPISQLKVSLLVWFLIKKKAPFPSIIQLTLSQARNIWGINYEDIINYNRSVSVKDKSYPKHTAKHNSYNDCIFNINFNFNIRNQNLFEWSYLYEVLLKKHGSLLKMQESVLKRCLRNRKSLENEYKIYLFHMKQLKSIEFKFLSLKEEKQVILNYGNYINIVKIIHKTLATNIEKILNLIKYQELMQNNANLNIIFSNSENMLTYSQMSDTIERNKMPTVYDINVAFNHGNKVLNKKEVLEKLTRFYCTKMFMEFLKNIINNFNLIYLNRILAVESYENDIINFVHQCFKNIHSENLPKLDYPSLKLIREIDLINLLTVTTEPINNNCIKYLHKCTLDHSLVKKPFNFHSIFDPPLQNVLLYLQRIHLIWTYKSYSNNLYSLLSNPYRMILFKNSY